MKFFIYFFTLTSFSQPNLSYFRDKTEQLEEKDLKDDSFIAFKNKINEGLNNGVFWIKIDNSNNQACIVELSSARLSDFSVSKNVEKFEHSIYPTFKIPKNTVSYIRINITKEAYVPIDVFSVNNYKIHQRNQLLAHGVYYGFAIMVLLINVLYFLAFKDFSFLFYAFFSITITLVLFIRDGLLGVFVDNLWILNESEIFIHFLSPIFGGVFTINFFKHELHLPKLKYLIIAFMLLALTSYLSYLATDMMIWYAVGDSIGMSLFLMNWILGICNSFKSIISRFYTIAFSLILFFGFDFIISTAFGLPNAGVTTDLLKVGAFFEMLILSYAVVYRMYAIQQENDKIRDELYLYTQEIKKLKELSNSKAESYRLTPRQIKILGLITHGFSNKEIADELKISINTVKYHIKIIYDELNVKSRKEVVNLKLNVREQPLV